MPFDNPIGFSPADFLELGLAVLLAVLALASRPWLEPLAARLAQRTRWSMLALAILPIALRLALIAHHPMPAPQSPDEFGNLLVADTLRYFRLSNPPHPLPQFFETLGVLQQPVYGSILPIGQGVALLIGRTIFGEPWAGVLLSAAALCALCYWMLRGWMTPLWALIGGGLAVLEFGPLNAWMNSYSGGALAAAGGCLVFGALPRLRKSLQPRDAALLALGLAVVILTQPYESLFLAVGAAWLLPWRMPPKTAAAALAVLIPALALAFHHHLQVHRSREQYGVPDTLTLQSALTPQRALTPQQALEYRAETSYREPRGETMLSYLLRLEFRVRYYRFFFLPALYLALPFAYRRVWVWSTLALIALGINLHAGFDLGMLAPATGLFVWASVAGLERLSRLNRDAAWVLLAFCLAHFLLWYGVHVFESDALMRYETWDGINHAGDLRRAEVNRELSGVPGRQLVFVQYRPPHPFRDEWVFNAARIDSEGVVWARDLGPEENAKLLQYYPDRTAWLLEPDARPPRLSAYSP